MVTYNKSSNTATANAVSSVSIAAVSFSGDGSALS